MNKPFAITGASIALHGAPLDAPLTDHALLIYNGDITSVVPSTELPADINVVLLDGGTLLPGFIDLQVNGGGGVLFNNDPSLEAIETICAAHRKLGTCRLLVTLISSTPDITLAAIRAGIDAARNKVPGFLGLHLEGPHLCVEKRGAHSASVLRPMTQQDTDLLCEASTQLPHLMVTVAPEVIDPSLIQQLNKAGIVVSLGHSNASFDDATSAFNNGASCATHLFNAMSPLTHREPGLVGAAINHPNAYASLIADGVHVHPAAINSALKAKSGLGKIFVVSDAMATAGSHISQFDLDGRTIVRKAGRLELADGTLAGADIDLLSSVRYLSDVVGIDRNEAIRMASDYPSRCIGACAKLGTIAPGHKANVLHVDSRLRLQQAWVDGVTQLDCPHTTTQDSKTP